MYDDFTFESSYPVIQWHNGARGKKSEGGVAYTGGWLLPADDLPANAQVNGVWQGPVNWTFESGKSEQVYTAGEVFIALLRQRRRWFGTNGDGATVYYTDAQARGQRGPSTTLRAGLRSHLQVLGVVVGVTATPVVLSVKGERSRALDRVLGEFYRQVVKPANEAAGEQLPLHYHWAKIGSSAVAGDEGFVTVGSGKAAKVIALPAAILPETVDAAYLQKAAVPDPVRALCAQWYREAEGWSKRWQHSPLDPVEGNGECDEIDENEIPY